MIISFANQKGGVGKTTTTLNLGASVASKGKKVCLIDLDPQANLTSGLGYTQATKEKKSIYDVLIEETNINEATINTRIGNLDLVPSTIELAGAEIELVNMLSRETILREALEDIKYKYDYIFIDCPPSLGLLTLNALTSSNEVFIPVQAEYFALEGLGQLINSIKLVKSKLNHGLQIGGVVLTMFDSRTNLSKDIDAEIQKVFGGKVYETLIPRNIRLSEAPSHGKAIHEYDPSSTGAEAYTKLAVEFISKH